METRNSRGSGTLTTIGAIALGMIASCAQADIDGHGPDAWRVSGVASNDVLNARMGPGTNYPVIDTFAHNERNMQQITCVPFYTAQQYGAMTQAQVKALPPRWCLMRDEPKVKAGWVAQRYITPEGLTPVTSSKQPVADRDVIAESVDLVRALYENYDVANSAGQRGPLGPRQAGGYFTDDIVRLLNSGTIGAHPLYGAQDFDGTVDEPVPDPSQPMLRGTVFVNVGLTNFGQPQRAVFLLRADPTKPGAPMRIFRVEHEGWSYP